ncbi:MAG: tRNA pseudouridine(38-40) synthase TruA [Desulfotomaculum sp.]|nr:tRNA pseudouridine(38-40) synthase TruA [Desulfotomaculum sp.]MCL0080772.1 tRNA pseudouridine(38-40) synthase TruA [Peptococcaceae bacterium]
MIKAANIKLTVGYDGTDYHGFQEQRGTKLITIQHLLEEKLSKLAKQPIKIIAAGRTDAGVHARGQVVNFKHPDWPVPLDRLPLAINALLPNTVVVWRAEPVSAEFHARFSALAKTYSYSIYNTQIPDPFIKRFVLHQPRLLDDVAMQKAAKYLIGQHDFKAFQAQGTAVKTTVRKITKLAIERQGHILKIKFTANGFLYNMVRIMVGTLMQVGLGKMEPAMIKHILASKNRAMAGVTVAPQGLCMEEVHYKKIT